MLFDADQEALKSFLNLEASKFGGSRTGHDPPPEDWSVYLYDSNRNAIAHAVRDPGKPVLDPDRPEDRIRLYRDCRLLDDLLREAIHQRWERPVDLVRNE